MHYSWAISWHLHHPYGMLTTAIQTLHRVNRAASQKHAGTIIAVAGLETYVKSSKNLRRQTNVRLLLQRPNVLPVIWHLTEPNFVPA